MMDIVELMVAPQTLVGLLAAVAAFATVLTVSLPLLDRDRRDQRMRAMAVERDKLRSARLAEFRKGDNGRLRQTNQQPFMRQIVDALDLKNRFDNEELRAKLKMAGLRGEGPVVAFLFFRVAMPPIMAIASIVYLFVIAKNLSLAPAIKMLIVVGCAFLGYYLPNVFVQNLMQKRQQSIKETFPDALDMLLICVQSGMSIEQAFGKVAREIGTQSIELAEEFSLTTAELSYLSDRRVAYENLGKRTGLPGIKSVAVALGQAERYGTPIGQALRTMAKENREMRMLEAEKKAAALPPKLTVPMIVFFLPVLFVVILGPAGIQVMKWN
jgi:tight adherence protein C